jgi:iron complex transport system ATP-binding protein
MSPAEQQAVPILSIDDVSFAFADAPVLEGVNLEIAEGEFICIVGPNGAGKSTLLRMLTRSLAPRSGSIRLMGAALESYAPRKLARLIAVVPQREEALFPFTVRTMVMLGRYPYLSGFGFERAEDHAKVEAAMDRVDLRALASRPVTELSGGELHRVIIARALAQDTPMILLDEPNAHLDIRYQVALFDLLRALNRNEHRTIIAVTHELNLASMYGDRIALFGHGRLHAVGTPEAVLTEQSVRDCFGIQVAVDIDRRSRATRVTLLPGE